MVYNKETDHASINTKSQMYGRRTTFDTTPMASHTVTLPSCEACINEEGAEEGEEEEGSAGREGRGPCGW